MPICGRSQKRKEPAVRIFWKNDNYILLEGLRDAATGEFVNDAVLTLDVMDANRLPLSGATGISMDYIAGSNGRYKGLIDDSVQTTIGTKVYVTITCSNYGCRWDEIPVDVEKRSGT
jgi:hypothetical protein